MKIAAFVIVVAFVIGAAVWHRAHQQVPDFRTQIIQNDRDVTQ